MFSRDRRGKRGEDNAGRTCNRLAKVISREMTAATIIESDIIWIHVVYVEIAIGVVIAIGLIVLRIS